VCVCVWREGEGARGITLVYAHKICLCVMFEKGGKLVGAWFSPQRRGRVMGIVTSGNNLGGLVFSQMSTRVTCDNAVENEAWK
jgi:sugar phosphate permease